MAGVIYPITMIFTIILIISKIEKCNYSFLVAITAESSDLSKLWEFFKLLVVINCFVIVKLIDGLRGPIQ
jgi:hypothetical protein